MPIVQTHLLTPNELRADTKQIYNGLDCCVTFEVFSALQRLPQAHSAEIYSFERAIQAPALEMMLRGWLVDEYLRRKAVTELETKLARLEQILLAYANAIWDKPLNPRSRPQMLAFFYGVREAQGETFPLPGPSFKFTPMWSSKKGVRKLSMDREALEKLEHYFHAMPIIAVILAIREITKQIEVLSTQIEADGRMRTSYNIAGTETGRWSSSGNAWGTGGNLQNINPGLRYIFVADPGWKICGIDLEQAESREVGWLLGTLFNDWTYLDACEQGDLHTFTARLIWPNLPWTGDLRRDRKIADQIFYRDFTYRDMSKRGGHGSSYLGTPWTMARHLKVPVQLMVDFQEKFLHRAFPTMPKWHRWTAQEIQTKSLLTTPFHRTRHFFGRTNDDATLREAIAFVPQSSTADRTNLGLWRIWKHMGSRVKVLHQNHDAVYFLYREDDNEREIISQALSLMEVEFFHKGRRFVVPGEAKVGWNWASQHNLAKPSPGWRDEKGTWHENRLNWDGLIKWKGEDLRKRTSMMDMVL